jgi:hypothetical protein
VDLSSTRVGDCLSLGEGSVNWCSSMSTEKLMNRDPTGESSSILVFCRVVCILSDRISFVRLRMFHPLTSTTF